MGRRFFLGGAGAAIAIPFLPSALGWMESRGRAHAQAASCDNPRRMVAWYVPCGIHMAAWRPTAAGRNFELPTILAPLESVRDKILVLSNIENNAGAAQGDGPGDHARGTGSFLTARHVRKTDGSDIRNGISVDQVAATQIGSCTRFPSLELGIDGGGNTGGCDSGYSCAYARNISWAGEATPMPKITDPRVVFERLFAGYDPSATQAEIARREAYASSILDMAVADAQSLRTRLGTDDRQKLDEYLTGVREVEARLQSEAPLDVCQVPDEPPSNLDITARVDRMSDLQAIAMQCDLTRVITFMMANAGSGRSYPELGVGGGHHALSHHDNNEDNFRQLVIIDTWEVERLAYFLGKLKTMTDASGTPLLDQTMLFFSSEISDGNRHNHNDLPVLVAGGAGGAWETGRHIELPNNTPVANLFIRMLHEMGANVSEFGDDGTEALASI